MKTVEAHTAPASKGHVNDAVLEEVGSYLPRALALTPACVAVTYEGSIPCTLTKLRRCLLTAKHPVGKS